MPAIVPEFGSGYNQQGVAAALRLFSGRVKVSGPVLSQITKLLATDEMFLRSVGVEGPVESFADRHAAMGAHRRTAKLSEARRTELLSMTPMGRAILHAEKMEGGK